MGTTPIYNLPFPDASESPNGPLQIEALANGVETELDRIDDTATVMDTLLDEFSPSGLAAAPVSTAAESSYPFGLSARDATTGLGYPTNGILLTYRYSTASRVTQHLTTSSTGVGTTKNYVRGWGTGPDWTPWVETSNVATLLPEPLMAQTLTAISAFSTSFAAGATVNGGTFVAPPSGKVYVTVSGRLECSADTHNSFLSWEMRTGATVGSGTILVAATIDRAVIAGQAVTPGAEAIASGGPRSLVVGLTAGASHNIRTMHMATLAAAGTAYSRRVVVEPVPLYG